MATAIISASVFEDSTFFLLARVLGTDGTAIQQADVNSITYKIFNLSVDSTTPDSSGTLTVGDSIFDTLQTDARWDVDSVGYNFRWQILSNVLTNPNCTYQIEVIFTSGANENFPAVWEVATVGLYSS